MGYLQDVTGEVIHLEYQLVVEATKTEAQIIAILETSNETQEFFNAVTNYFVDIWYDGLGTWHINIYGENQFGPNSLEAQIDDKTGQILWLHIRLARPATMTEAQVIDVLLNYSEAQAWFNTVTYYTINVYYDGYGYWYIDVYDHDTGYIYIFAEVNDTTGERTWIDVGYPPQMTDSQIIQIVLNHPDTAEWFSQVTNYEFSLWFNAFGSYWSIEFYDYQMGASYLYAEVDDVTGQLVYLEFQIAQPAMMIP